MSGGHAFCRLQLRDVMREVRRYVPCASDRKRAWVWQSPSLRCTAEFHGPGDFYWHGGADCLWEARALGWEAYLDQHYPDRGDRA